MDELISRKVAIDALKAIRTGLWKIDIPSPTVPEYVEHHEQIKNMMDITDGWIKRLSEEQPAQQWIPVTERLPESKEEDLEYPTVLVCFADESVTMACFYESTKEWGCGDEYDRVCHPIAWMPLPEPYREEGTE